MLIHRHVNPDSLQLLASSSSEPHLWLLINTRPNETTTVFIGGPKILVRNLELPTTVLYAWLHFYRAPIAKFARKTMDLFPPNERYPAMSLSLKEYLTETWKTIFIRTEGSPSSVALTWQNGPNGGVGAWTILKTPKANGVISGGFGSYAVHSFEPKG